MAPPVYLDECVDYALGEALRERGFTVFAAVDLGMGQAPDEQQLSYAAARGWVLLTFNRDHFRRLDLRFREEGRPHGGIIGLPQRQPFTRLVVRAAMMLRWKSDKEVQSRYFNWNDLQMELLSLCVGNRAPSFHEFGPDEVAHALGFA